jgi:uncharacterized protein (UPF0210 family)
MEDIILAQRAAELPPTYSIRELLTYSAICGVGLDTVPVPGDITVETIEGLFIETGTMAYRLNKPLSCRLLPMPGKAAGDMTEVSSPHICNTRVFSV